MLGLLSLCLSPHARLNKNRYSTILYAAVDAKNEEKANNILLQNCTRRSSVGQAAVSHKSTFSQISKTQHSNFVQIKITKHNTMVSFFAVASILACCGVTAATEDTVSYSVVAPLFQQTISHQHSVLAPVQTQTSANDPTSFLRKRRSDINDEERRTLLESCNLPDASADYDCGLQDGNCTACCWYDKNDISIAFSETTQFDSTVTPYADIIKQCYSKADASSGTNTCHCGPAPPTPTIPDDTQSTGGAQITGGTCRVPESVYDCSNHDDQCSECCWYSADLTQSNFTYDAETTNSKQCYKKMFATGDTCHCGPVPTDTSSAGNASPNASPNAAPDASSAGGGQCTIPGDTFDCAGYGSSTCGDCCYYTTNNLALTSAVSSSLTEPSLECYRKTFNDGSDPVCTCGPVPAEPAPAPLPAALSTLETCNAPGEAVACGTDCGTCCHYNVNDPTETYPTVADALPSVWDTLTRACYMQTHSSGSEACTCGPIPDTVADSTSQEGITNSTDPTALDNGTCQKPGEEIACGENACNECCFYNVNDTMETYASTTGLTNEQINGLTKACYEASNSDDSKTCTCGPIPPSGDNFRYRML
jgi:hypothetical protein